MLKDDTSYKTRLGTVGGGLSDGELFVRRRRDGRRQRLVAIDGRVYVRLLVERHGVAVIGLHQLKIVVGPDQFDLQFGFAVRVLAHEVVAHGGQQLALEQPALGQRRLGERSVGRVIVAGVAAMAVRRVIAASLRVRRRVVVPAALRYLHAGHHVGERRRGRGRRRLLLFEALEQLRVAVAAQHHQPRHAGRGGRQQHGHGHVERGRPVELELLDRVGRDQNAEVLRVLVPFVTGRRFVLRRRRRHGRVMAVTAAAAADRRRLHLLYAAGRDERVVVIAVVVLVLQLPDYEHRARIFVPVRSLVVTRGRFAGRRRAVSATAGRRRR